MTASSSGRKSGRRDPRPERTVSSPIDADEPKSMRVRLRPSLVEAAKAMAKVVEADSYHSVVNDALVAYFAWQDLADPNCVPPHEQLASLPETVAGLFDSERALWQPRPLFLEVLEGTNLGTVVAEGITALAGEAAEVVPGDAQRLTGGLFGESTAALLRLVASTAPNSPQWLPDPLATGLPELIQGARFLTNVFQQLDSTARWEQWLRELRGEPALVLGGLLFHVHLSVLAVQHRALGGVVPRQDPRWEEWGLLFQDPKQLGDRPPEDLTEVQLFGRPWGLRMEAHSVCRMRASGQYCHRGLVRLLALYGEEWEDLGGVRAMTEEERIEIERDLAGMFDRGKPIAWREGWTALGLAIGLAAGTAEGNVLPRLNKWWEAVGEAKGGVSVASPQPKGPRPNPEYFKRPMRLRARTIADALKAVNRTQELRRALAEVTCLRPWAEIGKALTAWESRAKDVTPG